MSLLCPLCSGPTEKAEWSETRPDHEGEPLESSGFGLYCVKKSCPKFREAIEEEDYSEHECTNGPEDGCEVCGALVEAGLKSDA